MSDDFRRELEFLDKISSPSFAQGAGGERLRRADGRALKEQLLWAWTFSMVEELAAALRQFKRGCVR
jgi:hypothetical protein